MKLLPLSFALVLAFPLVPFPALGKSCTADSECGKGRLCHASQCVALTNAESLVAIRLAAWVPDAVLSIDGLAIGALPWEGIISAGRHTMKVEAPGYLPTELASDAPAKTRIVFELSMQPEPEPPPAPVQTVVPEQAEEEDGARVEPGRFYVALLGGGGYGTAMWGDTKMRPVGAILGGGAFGLRLIEKPFWLDLGLSAKYGTRFVQDWPDAGDIDFETLFVGLLPRALFAVYEDLVHVGVELELGVVVSNRMWFYGELRGAVAFAVHRNVEIRVNPLGVEWLQDFGGKGAMVSYTGTLGLAARFP